MKKFFLFCLFLIGLGWAVSNFSGLANQGSYDSIVLDFRESLGKQEIANQVRIIAEKYQIVPFRPPLHFQLLFRWSTIPQ
jgi:serine protease